MKAYQIQSAIGIEGLKLVELPEPHPGYGQVLVKVRATSLNYRDLVVLQGGYGRNQKTPLIPLSDGAGEVAAVGEGVTRFQIGDRVAGTFFQDWVSGGLTKEVFASALGGLKDGMLAEYVVLHERGVVQIPEHLSYEEAATLPCAALTAWQALVTRGNLKAGDSILVLGTGGVSMFALQFALLHGARVLATSSSHVKLEKVTAMGASDVINYRETPDWDAEVKKMTQGVGVDHVVEVGGAGTLSKSINAVRVDGRVSLIGVLSGGKEINPMMVLMKTVTLQGIYVGSRDMFEAMNRAIGLHRLKPLVDRVFPLNEAPEAYGYLKSGAHFGKVVISFD